MNIYRPFFFQEMKRIERTPPGVFDFPSEYFTPLPFLRDEENRTKVLLGPMFDFTSYIDKWEDKR